MGNIEAKIKKTFKKPLTRKATNSTNGEISSFSMGKKSTNDAQRVDAVTAKHMLNFSMVSSASRGSKSFNKQALQVVQKVQTQDPSKYKPEKDLNADIEQMLKENELLV